MLVRILIIDCNDSFTYNLKDYFFRLGATCDVVNESIVDMALIDKYDGIVFSPGPGHPRLYPNLLEIMSSCYKVKPILGVCLGMQLIAHFFGMPVVKTAIPMHGKTSDIYHDQREIYHKIPLPINIMRYHSLIINNVSEDFKVTSKTKDNLIMSFKHKSYNLTGVQYHPESILTERGIDLLDNWIQFCVKN